MAPWAKKSLRFIGRWLRRAINAAIILILLAALLGRIVRDRNVLFALMMYLPLLPIDAMQRGRVVPRVRFALLGAGAIATLWSLITLINFGGGGTAAAADVRLLQWNTQWGGALRSVESWSHTSSRIVAARPDIVILNEGPNDPLVKLTCEKLGSEWKFVEHDELRFNPHYQIRLVAASRWPIKIESILRFPSGGGIVVTVAAPQRPYRILAVDGISNPNIVRTPFLRAIAHHCRAASDNGQPIDIIAGDFNSVGHSIGFDEFRRSRYGVASRAHSGWVGTFPSQLPLYDIDHVWLIETLSPLRCEMFSSPTTNHRGQLVILR
jgi:endonuclease/exonuclease/phosphatase (EEP) superfamily protein YafD